MSLYLRKDIEKLDLYTAILSNSSRYTNFLNLNIDSEELNNNQIIQFLLFSLPLQNIYCFENRKGVRYPIINQNYLTVAYSFYNNEFPFLNHSNEYNNCFFKDLPLLLQSRFEDYSFSFITIQPPSEKSVIKDFFSILGCSDFSYLNLID